MAVLKSNLHLPGSVNVILIVIVIMSQKIPKINHLLHAGPKSRTGSCYPVLKNFTTKPRELACSGVEMVSYVDYPITKVMDLNFFFKVQFCMERWCKQDGVIAWVYNLVV